MKHRPAVFYIKAVLAFLTAAALLGILSVYLVYNGYWQLNHPSRSRYPVRGVDVSHYQGEIDWEVLAGQDIRFAYIKATEGSSHTDNMFAKNWAAAGETGLAAGAYHFFSFDSPGENQAAHFIGCLDQANIDRSRADQVRTGQTQTTQAQTAQTQAETGSMLPPAVDVEYYGDKKVNPPDPEAVRDSLQNYLDLVEDHYHMTPVIYSTEEVWEQYLKGYFDEYPLWIRNVKTRPRKDADWTFWQYSNRARLDGYSGEESYIDLNVFCGSEREWENRFSYLSSISSFKTSGRE